MSVCHYCGEQGDSRRRCPNCGGNRWSEARWRRRPPAFTDVRVVNATVGLELGPGEFVDNNYIGAMQRFGISMQQAAEAMQQLGAAAQGAKIEPIETGPVWR